MQLDKLLNSVVRKLLTEAVIIDPHDLEASAKGLESCRGACIGWDDYDAGRDYEPPRAYMGEEPIGPAANPKKNPHSQKYEGVRPWSPQEVLKVLYKPGGLLDMISHKKRVIGTFQHTYKRSPGDEDFDNIRQLGAMGALKGINKDQGRKGVRFLSYIGTWIEPAMTEGPSTGFHDEYRDTRGIISKLETLMSRARKNMVAGRPATAELAGIHRIGEPIDPVGGKANPLGNLAPKLVSLIELLSRAINSGDVQNVEQAIQTLMKFREDIETEEEMYTTRGIARDTVIGKSKSMPAIPVGGLTTTNPKSGEEVERRGLQSNYDTYVAGRREIMDVLARALHKLRVGEGSGKAWEAEQALALLSKFSEIIKQRQNFSASNRYQLKQLGPSDFQVIDTTTGNAIAQDEDPNQLAGQVRELNANRLVTQVRNLSDRIIGADYGQYTMDLKEIASRLIFALEQGDEDEISEVEEEIALTRNVADSDRGDERSVGMALNPTAYRILLRQFGLSNYPERGTPDDPELDADGQPSEWARNGYPRMDSDVEIAADLGVSGQTVGTNKKRWLPKISELFSRLQQESRARNDVVDTQLLREAKIAVGYALQDWVFSGSELIT